MQQTETRFDRRRRESRTRLLRAARELFAEQGLHETSISQIAQRADLGLGTFYLHFGGKDDVLAAVIDDELTSMLAALREATAGIASPLERHRLGTRLYLRHAYENRQLFRILFEQVPGSHAVLRGARRRWEAVVESLVRDALAQSEAITDNAALVARLMVAMVGEAALWWMEHETPGPDEVAATVSAFVEHGLRGAGPAHAAPALPAERPRFCPERNEPIKKEHSQR